MIKERRRKSALPMALIADFDQFEIGTRVYCTHRAAVARYRKLWKDYEPDPPPIASTINRNAGIVLDFSGAEPEKAPLGWKIVEGCLKNELVDDGFQFDGMNYNHRMYSFAEYPRAKFGHGQQYNKTVMVWPSEFYGWIIGMVRKGIGESHKGSYYGGGYYDPPDYDPGYLSVDMYVDLYVIKLYYQGTDYVYAPLWAAQKVGE